jgi:cytochrome c oxidase cbb3-type subunit 1
MIPIVSLLLVFTFLLSVAGLFVLIWSISTGQFSMGPDAPKVIFDKNEIGHPEDPASTGEKHKALREHLNEQVHYTSASDHVDKHDLESRFEVDRVARWPVLYLVTSAVAWLVVGSLFGLIVSLKFHWPDWLVGSEFETFGRLRPLHLNTVIYGWVSMAGMGVALWLVTRILKTPLIGAIWALIGTTIWNFAVVVGTIALFFGWTDGVEWLEYPWQIDMLFALSGAMIGIPILLTIKNRKVQHLYVSVWYIGAAFVWFPFLFVIANFPGVHFGVQHAIVNWWFAHNVLGLWLTPLGLGAAYYFIPKVLGKPIHSYQLSLLGFWSLALFYSQVGLHHLIGGPVPTWIVTLSIVTSVMMFVPVIAVAVNHHATMIGHFKAMRFSPTLAFVVSGAMMYTLTSFQGSLQSLRWLNTITHFTHSTIAHAHLGVYGFVSFIMFGSLYFILPRLTRWEWPYPKLIQAHYWLSLSGIGVYFIFLTIGGTLQGLKMLDPNSAFMDSVLVVNPYLIARSVGGSLMLVAHFVFAYHVFALLKRSGPVKESAPFRYDPHFERQGVKP